MMPEVDGYQVCSQLRSDPATAELRVFMLTALDDPESRLRAFRAGADDFLTKPLRRAETLTRIQSIARLNRYRALIRVHHQLARTRVEADLGAVPLDEIEDRFDTAVDRLDMWFQPVVAVAEDGAQGFGYEALMRAPTRPFDNPLAMLAAGLGLSLVRQLAELHGGGVAVESVPGEGSRFTVTLPVRQPDGMEPVEPGTSGATRPGEGPPSGSYLLPELHPEGPLVLLTEDHEINVRTLTAFLESHGYRVAVARNGREAVDRTHEERPAVILMDIQMPGMDGLAAMRELRGDDRTSRIPIIALTALAMAGDRERCLEAGANEYMSKPVRLGELVRLVRRFTTAEAAPRPTDSG